MKIVLATFGSLGDLHPMIALGLELKSREFDVTVAAMEFYREKIETTGLGYSPMRPHFDTENRELARDMMDAKKGPEIMIKEIIFPQLFGMYKDLMKAVKDADLFVTGEVVYVAKSVSEKSGIKWISTSLAPISLFSSHDPNVYPPALWYEYLHFLPVAFHRTLFNFMRGTISDWFEPYKKFRREIGLDENHDPVFLGKYSDLLHLVMFSKVLAKPQPDWYSPTLQTGFCFYDGQKDSGKMPEDLQEYLDTGEPPIVFTLGSAAVLDAGNFFEESAKAAKILNRRAVLLYGIVNDPPDGLSESIVGFDYAPFSHVFPKASVIVHQGGVGTTGQVLRAGVPALVMPYSHDQFDNASRCRKIGVAETISRENYNSENAAKMLKKILSDANYYKRAKEVGKIVESENGTRIACDAIEEILRK